LRPKHAYIYRYCSYTYLRSYLLIPFGDQHLYIFDVSSAELYIQPLQQTPSIGHAIGDDLKHYIQ
jgi:hypothetical protein